MDSRERYGESFSGYVIVEICISINNMTGYTRELRSSCEKGTSLPFDRQTGELGTPRLFLSTY
jgi:hypothetical protein